MMKFVIILLSIASYSSCKQLGVSGVHYNQSELMGIDTSGSQKIEGSTSLDIGRAALNAGVLPNYYGIAAVASNKTGFNLSSASTLKAGDRGCISASYQKGEETATKCGVLELCRNRDGFLADVEAGPNDLCFRADCLSKGTNGLDMSLENRDKICMQGRGVSTGMNITKYLQRSGQVAMGVDKLGGGLSLTNTQNYFSAQHGIGQNSTAFQLNGGRSSNLYENVVGQKNDSLNVTLGGETFASGAKSIGAVYKISQGNGIEDTEHTKYVSTNMVVSSFTRGSSFGSSSQGTVISNDQSFPSQPNGQFVDGQVINQGYSNGYVVPAQNAPSAGALGLLPENNFGEESAKSLEKRRLYSPAATVKVFFSGRK